MNNTETLIFGEKRRSKKANLKTIFNNEETMRILGLTQDLFIHVKTIAFRSLVILKKLFDLFQSYFLNLRIKWMLSTFLFIVLFSISLVYFFLYSGKINLERELEKWGTSLASNIATNAQYATIVKDTLALQNYLVGIMNWEEIVYAAILDEYGSILAIQNPKWMFEQEIHNFSARTIGINKVFTTSGIDIYNIVEPIEIKITDNLLDEQILFDGLENPIHKFDDFQSKANTLTTSNRSGTVVLGISLEKMNEKLSNMRNRAIAIAFGIALICFCFVFWGFKKITTPIAQLVEATGKVAQGNLSHFVKNERRDELGLLANSFNEMIVKLKKSNEKVKHYMRTLEKQVNDRTQELRESEKKYRALFEHSGAAVTVIDEDDTLSMVNKEFEMLSGYSKNEIERKMVFTNFINRNSLKLIKEYCNNRQNRNELGNPLNYECTFIHRSGKPKKTNLTMSIIPGSRKILASLADVSEVRELQRKLNQAEQLAAIGELSAAIAHEIRNPLGAINTSVGILKKGLNLTGQDRELMEIICEESMRLNRIISDFIQFARPNEPKLKKANINNLIHETLLLFRDRIGGGIQKCVQLTKDISLIMVDPNQLKQVMMNIIINAIEAMPAGGLLNISTREVMNLFGKHQVEIIFTDTGCGIADANLKKIFQPFYSTKEKGGGMGLSICERIIQNHGGEIKVESKVGQGTQFTISLPVNFVKY